jgi:hypothetical protein
LPPAPVRIVRDLRLDLFRGLALLLIFLDHIPSNVVSWVTVRNYGFSDATEIFIFISGYANAYVYGAVIRRRGFIDAAAWILNRAWQIYLAQIFLFVIYIGEIAYLAGSSPYYTEEANLKVFLQQPDLAMLEALLLKFRPVNLDILPLYVILMLGFPPFLWLLSRNLTLGLAVSVALYAVARALDWNFAAYPTGSWYFNPFAWQLLFVFGAWCALGGAERMQRVVRSPVVLTFAAAYLAFAFCVVMTWHFQPLARFVPGWMAKFLYPIDKSNLDLLRFAHFLALAVLVVRLVPRDGGMLASPLLRPIIRVGQRSLEIFGLGVFLAFAGHFATVDISASIAMQVLVSALGIAAMIAVALLISWYDSIGTPFEIVAEDAAARGAVETRRGHTAEP